MTLPLSGPMSASMINLELGRAGAAPFDINGAAERALAEVPSGEISFSDFYGKPSGPIDPPVLNRFFEDAFSQFYSLPVNVANLIITIYGGGGKGGDVGGAGGGGGGSGAVTRVVYGPALAGTGFSLFTANSGGIATTLTIEQDYVPVITATSGDRGLDDGTGGAAGFSQLGDTIRAGTVGAPASGGAGGNGAAGTDLAATGTVPGGLGATSLSSEPGAGPVYCSGGGGAFQGSVLYPTGGYGSPTFVHFFSQD